MKNTLGSRLILLGLWGIMAGAMLAAPEVSAMQAEGRPGGRAQPVSPPAGGAATRDSDIADAEWSMTIQPDATVLILHKGAPVVRTQHLAWGRKNPLVWAGGYFKAERVRPGEAILTGGIGPLDLKATGSIRAVAENALRVEYNFVAAKAHEDIKGAVLDWKFELNSPSFDKKPQDPVFFPDFTGWSWTVGPDQTIIVRFDQPQDLVHYEVNQKNNIRTYYYADRIEPGTRQVSYTVQLPEGGRVAPSLEDLYGSTDTSRWFRDAMSWDGSPIDLSFLNEKERPAGRRGPLKADGDRLVFEDGTTARFWGSNLCAVALFSTPKPNVRRQARRMSELGFNMMRIHQHDAPWSQPNIFRDKTDTRHFNPKSLDSIDWWVKCLKDEGIYVWLDLIYNRTLAPGDGVKFGFDEIEKKKGTVWGFNYVNPEVANLMREFQHQYLNHVNPYTRLAYKDDPAVLGVLITNENDLTHHFGNMLLPANGSIVHGDVYMKAAREFALRTGLPANKTWETWVPGPGKIFLNDLEHRFNRSMIDDLRNLGLRTTIATTNYWAGCSQYSLPALSEGDMIDIHSYGKAEALSTNSRYETNFISWTGAAQVQGKPLSVSEWTVPFPEVDRFTAPLYMASIASLQSWDMPMHFNYAHIPLVAPGKADWERKIESWCSYNDPAICGVMPAAALAFRQGHIKPASTNYCLMLDRQQLFDRVINPATSATIRTLVEQSRFTIGFPAVKELPWLEPTETPKDATVITDPDHDYIPAGQKFVKSDTGELIRNWKFGIQTIDSPKTQAVSGWIGGKFLKLSATTFQFDNAKAVVALSSLDDQPLSKSRYILVTAIARAIPITANRVPYMSEPVVGTITLRTETTDLQLLALGANGKVVERLALKTGPDGVTFGLPTRRGTHWYALKAARVPTPGRNQGTAAN